MKIDFDSMAPKEIVESLDEYIIGQQRAKKVVAIAMRNRIRRQKLPEDVKKEIIPKNILMIGPTGVGKTEIARRLAEIAGAPFVKVEATKFTEVGYVGKDVESMIRDLVRASIRMVKNEMMEAIRDEAERMVKERIADYFVPRKKSKPQQNPMQMLTNILSGSQQTGVEPQRPQQDNVEEKRKKILNMIDEGKLDDQTITIEIEETAGPKLELFGAAGMEEMGMNFSDMFSGMFPKKKKLKRLTVREAKKLLYPIEADKLIDQEEVNDKAIKRAEERGIIFIDEMDKIASSGKYGNGPDVSREGVQRDLLPIIEGASVYTKYGNVKTDYILFIAAGAFHISKPSDLIPELQGRFPIRVELDSLTSEDFERILTEPKNAITKQYSYMLETEGVDLSFDSESIKTLAEIAYEVNSKNENIGARRLYTVMEKLLEDILFNAPDVDRNIVITKSYVEDKLKSVVEDKDLSAYIL
jgi:ATP-dependent HslUV protease ATP-binding subunit HslU